MPTKLVSKLSPDVPSLAINHPIQTFNTACKLTQDSFKSGDISHFKKIIKHIKYINGLHIDDNRRSLILMYEATNIIHSNRCNDSLATVLVTK